MMRIAGAIVWAMLVALSSRAAVVITVETTDLTKKKPAAEVGRITIDGQKMAMRENSSEEVPQMIFRGDRQKLYAINPRQEEYIEIDKATMDRMGGQMDTMMKQMEEKLAELPPQQRAMVEKMMRKQMPDPAAGGAPMGKPSVKRTGEQEAIGGYSCRLYEVYLDDRKVREIWVTDWSNVDQGREAFAIFSDLEQFFEGLMDAMKNSPFAGAMQNPFDQASKMDGFPILTREFKNGKATRESLFKSVENADPGPAAFEPPEGYKRRDLSEELKKQRPR